MKTNILKQNSFQIMDSVTKTHGENDESLDERSTDSEKPTSDEDTERVLNNWSAGKKRKRRGRRSSWSDNMINDA